MASSWPSNNVVEGLMAAIWPWTSVLGGLTDSTWFGGPGEAKFALQQHLGCADSVKLALELRAQTFVIFIHDDATNLTRMATTATIVTSAATTMTTTTTTIKVTTPWL